jgi:hypothetical protein
MLLYILDFLTFEFGADGLSQNVCNELPLYAAKYLTRAQTSKDNFVMQTLVWLEMVQFRAIRFGVVWTGICEFITSHIYTPHFSGGGPDMTFE